MGDSEISGPVPFGVRDDGSVLDGVNPEAISASPAFPADRGALAIKASQAGRKLGVSRRDIDTANLGETGWAVLFGLNVDQKIKDALKPLLGKREKDVGDDARLYKEFHGDYVPGESATDWVNRHGSKTKASVVPLEGVPYYVLIVAPPVDIPFEFQYGLDLMWAVGRIWFDSPDDFRQYADSVVQYETDPQVETSRQLTFFAPCNQRDVATPLLTNQVVNPLLTEPDVYGRLVGQKSKFKLQSFTGESAEKDSLCKIMQGETGRPALLFTGSHGKSVTQPDDPALSEFRGSLICQEWIKGVPATPDQVFAGVDITDNSKVHGMIHFMFACYGVGWPEFDNYSRTAAAAPRIAPAPSLARLPSKLLAHRDGGVLAVLGHIDRAWGWSFESDDGTAQNGDFRLILNDLMAGTRIGDATDSFNSSWGARSIEIAETLQQLQNGDRKLTGDSLKKFANKWVARDDARNYIIFGDPAVRLRTEDMDVLS